jgi:hypothetical protein
MKMKRPIDGQVPSPRHGLKVSGNPTVMRSAHSPIDVNGRTPTSRGTKVWRESVRAATPIQHADGKQDGKDIGRPKVVTW